jgi:phage shock protein PspC (stress-responsive transcriptional regulator)
MKKTIKISLGGIAFNIEEDAFMLLDDYIKTLRAHLGKSEESEEIVKDIEERTAELFVEQLGKLEIVTIDIVSKVIQILGKPEQITNDESEETTTKSETSVKDGARKRLYRDIDNAIISGVCSGLAAYFRIDPLVFRILFAVLIFANGLGLIAYLILWIAVPRAETTRQRLEMRGEEINFANLEKNIKKEFENVKNNLNKQRNSGAFDSFFNAIGRIFVAIGKGLEGVFKVIGIILAIVLISVGLTGLLAVVGSIFIGGVAFSGDYLTYSGLSMGEFLGSAFDLGSFLWISIPVFLIIAIPLLSIIYLGLRIVLRFKVRDSIILVSAGTLWIVSVVALAFIVFLQARSFTIRESVKENLVLTIPAAEKETLIVKAMDLADFEIIPEKPIKIDDYTLAIDDGKTIIVGNPRIFIGKAEGENFELKLVKKSRGGTKHQAKISAERVSLNHSIIDSTLSISPYFFLSKGDKWRVQEVEVYINVPDGKHIFVDKSIENLLSSDQPYCSCWPDELAGKTWVMKGERLVEL